MGGLEKGCKEPYSQKVACIIKLALTSCGISFLFSTDKVIWSQQHI